jgi:hypothetical protein
MTPSLPGHIGIAAGMVLGIGRKYGMFYVGVIDGNQPM